VFLACSCWFVDALNAAGRDDEAVELFERLLDVSNDVGLLSKEWDPTAHRQLGNTPQPYSHTAVIVTGLQLHKRRHPRSDQPVPAA
jgi:GH15 family glucan-1,4-alpha-glucosidase